MDTSLPLTKFRAPRLRTGVVPRAELVARLQDSVSAHPVTLVCAPGGSGKTTVLAQLADAARATGAAVVWIAIDEEDDDANRLFAALVLALEPLGLNWEVPPRELIARVAGMGVQTRAALAAAVNALCSSVAGRVVVIFDDLHRVAGNDVFALLESLVERLPEHVSLIFGARVEPPLPVARWRAHGEVGEFSLADLRFTAVDAARLVASHGEPVEGAVIQDALRRTQGWAVGLSMLLHARQPLPLLDRGRARALAASGETGQRKLFAYLAQEVLERLPVDLQDFLLRSSILTELSPELCEALTGREDAGAVLQELYRRDLFLAAIDDRREVLRFHDLFREFLESELSRRLPLEVRSLHERAARAEAESSRAIHHFLRAGLWDEALWLILRVGEQLIAEGAIATVERWIDQIPEHARRDDAQIGYLRGSCAWLRWDWARTRRELTPAVAGLTAPLQLQSRVRGLFQLVDALSSSGHLDDAWRHLDQAEALPLDDAGRAELALLRAWCRAAVGDLESVAAHMQEFVQHVERDPESVCPITAGRIHCVLIGIPGVAEVFGRFAELSRQIARGVQSPWQLAAMGVEGWAALWRGDLDATRDTIARAEALHLHFGSIRLVGERLGQLRATFIAASGQPAAAFAAAQLHIEGIRAPELAWHRAAWLRAYQHALARMSWMAGERDPFLALLPALTAPRGPQEWPFVDVAADVVRGQAALLRGDPRAALEPLSRAVEGYARHRLPIVFSDPRLSLAGAWAALGDTRRAWQVFEPIYRDVVTHDHFGLLLLDSRTQVLALLDATPLEVRRAPASAMIRARLDQWTAASSERRIGAPAGPLARLTEREREVLAQVAGGAGNKHIARALDLSLHTVKRHIANILDKLDCASRGQAAELYRRARP